MPGHSASRRCDAAILSAVVLALAATACGAIGRGITDAPRSGEECDQAARFAFVGEATLAELGLAEFGEEGRRRGMIWVTLDRVDVSGWGPRPVGGAPALRRVVCVQWPDGSGMVTTIDDDWQAPGFSLTSAAATENLPVTLLVLVGGVILLAGISILAFRQGDRQASHHDEDP